MSSEIEIEEYVRTEKGKIFKYGKGRAYLGKDNQIVKHSKNITDLIEVRDILKIREDNSIAYLGLEKDEITVSYQDIISEIKNGKIELLEILTHEQFETNSYKVGV